MLLKRSFCVALLIVLSTWIVAGHASAADPKPSEAALPVQVKPMMINQVGKEHFGNSVYRRGTKGPRIAASGTRILEWPIQASATTTEVFPNSPHRYSNGACAMDVNGDGIDEMIVGREYSPSHESDVLWFEEVSGQKRWKEHLVGRLTEKDEPHDIMPIEASVAGKAVRGVAVLSGRRFVYWYQIPGDATQPWEKHTIADFKQSGMVGSESGMVLGDVSGNGRPDVVSGNFWAVCPADPTSQSWTVHRYSDWDGHPLPGKSQGWGGMNQLELGDLDGDGKLDIVASEAEIPGARLGVFCRDAANPDGLWKLTLVDSGLYCPHSLVVVDVNGDGRPDIVAGEMTAGGWQIPKNARPKIYLYLNEGNLKFHKYVLYSGWGVHMMRMAPRQPGDNNVFVFAADEIQSWYKDMTTHVVGWTISSK